MDTGHDRGQSITVNLGVLGFGVGLASLLANFKRKPAAIIGMVAGLLAVALELSLIAIGSAA